MIIVHSQCWFYTDVPCTPLGNLHYHCLTHRRVVDASPSPAVPSTSVLDTGQKRAPLCSKASRRSTCPRKDCIGEQDCTQYKFRESAEINQLMYRIYKEKIRPRPSTKAWAQLNRLPQSSGVVTFD